MMENVVALTQSQVFLIVGLQFCGIELNGCSATTSKYNKSYAFHVLASVKRLLWILFYSKTLFNPYRSDLRTSNSSPETDII